MKISRILITSVSVFTLLMLTGCEGKGTTEVKEVAKEVASNAKDQTHKHGNIDTHGGKESASMQGSAMAVGGSHSGTVIEVLDADPYTYANIKTKNGNIWVAVPRADIKKDMEINFNENMRVVDFESKTLGKTFDVLVFANELQSDKPIKKIKPEHPHENKEHSHDKIETPVAVPAATAAIAKATESTDSNKSEDVVAKKITSTAKGITTIAEVYAKKADLNGTIIKVVGKVTKVSEAIMGKNWVHIQDGTGAEGSNDLLFTSPAGIAAVGDKVTAEGKVAIDQDLGYGYFYSVIIQESTFSKK